VITLPQTKATRIATTVFSCLFVAFVLAVLLNLVGVGVSVGLLLTAALCVYLFDI
jgi:hypothetical protein